MRSLTDMIETSPLDGTTKGMPPTDNPVTLGTVGAQGWNVIRGDLVLPVLTLRESRFANNLASMRAFAEHHGLALAPHGKTPMAPQLFRRYVDEGGAWGVSVATVQQAAVAAAAGVPHVLIPNQVVARANVERLATLRAARPDGLFAVFVDSEAALEHLVRFGPRRLAKGDRFDILIEVGAQGARTGTRTLAHAEALIKTAASRADVLRIVGVGCYEGAISRPDADEACQAVDDYLGFTVDVFNRAAAMDAFAEVGEAILTGGGSVWFDRVARAFTTARFEHPVRTVLRCGSYAFIDHVMFQDKLAAIDARSGFALAGGPACASDAFLPALELWAAVQSLQDPGVAIVTMGRRDLPHDAGWPIPLRQYRDGAELDTISAGNSEWAVLKSDDQHAYMRVPPAADVKVGDLFAFGLSHPCSAFDRWDVVYQVDEAFNVLGAVKTFF